MFKANTFVFVILFVVCTLLASAHHARASFRLSGTIAAHSDLVRTTRAPARVETSATRRPHEIVFLHGTGERPEDGCHALRATLMEAGYTRCPRGNMAFGPGFTWGGSVAQLVAQLDREPPPDEPTVDALARPSVLVAFSQGGYVAPQILAAQPGRFSGLLVIGATVQLSRAWLASVGVRRVAFAAGRWDMTYEGMRKAARGLAAQGAEVRFVDLGAVGHTYFAKEPRDVAAIVAWLAGADDA